MSTVSLSSFDATPVYTPNFDTVFKSSKVRTIFIRPGKRNKKKRWRLFPQVSELHEKIRAHSGKECCKNECLQSMDPEFMDLAAKWRKSWVVTPYADRRAALLAHAKRNLGPSQAMEHGTCLRGDRTSLVLTADNRRNTRIPFLGKHYCRKAFLCCTGVSSNAWTKASRLARMGVETWGRKKRCQANPRTSEMYQAIWLIIEHLHLQSPFAGRHEGSATQKDDKWHVPFHHKVGLWRLVKKLWNGVPGVPDVPDVHVFNRKPSYHLFKAVMRLPEIKQKVVFHRIVDIGRCSKCQYFEWKCSSVPVALRAIWQEALAKHHMIQIAQKRCYMQDRAAAAAAFPHMELYMDLSRDKYLYSLLPPKPPTCHLRSSI